MLTAGTVAAALALAGVTAGIQLLGPADGDPEATAPSVAPPSTPAPAPPSPTASAAPSSVQMQNSASGLPFMLGAGGDGVANGQYAAALGRELDLASTWADDSYSQRTLTQLKPGGEFGAWNGSMDIAIGAFDRGGSWASAASGAYDAQWAATLRGLKAARSGRAGTTYLRFAHEMNGDWYAWSVTAAQTGDFISAWHRFRALQQQIYPEAELVFCVNQNTVGYEGDWTALYPGAGQVDVMGVDHYNNAPTITTDAEFADHLRAMDAHGAPVGLSAHLAFAASVGLPLAVSEWSAADTGAGSDSPAFIRGMYGFLSGMAGTGPGRVLYASQFNVSRGHDGDFNLLIGSRLPASTAEFKRLFGR